ncbi:MAG: hypothetical protein GY835_03880 [bacterium]|nr:hypothetical protein [bacterium]
MDSPSGIDEETYTVGLRTVFARQQYLPATSIGILAWMRSEAAGALGGSYDSMASPVAYPWTETVEIEALE